MASPDQLIMDDLYHCIDDNYMNGWVSELHPVTIVKDESSSKSSPLVVLSSETQPNLPWVEKKADKKIKKPRFAFQTRSRVDILDDGYHWPKICQEQPISKIDADKLVNAQKLLQMYSSRMQCEEASPTPIQRRRGRGDHLRRIAHASN